MKETSKTTRETLIGEYMDNHMKLVPLHKVPADEAKRLWARQKELELLLFPTEKKIDKPSEL